VAIELKIPPVGESISEVQISQWLKAEGDVVRKDEPIVVMDSEKTTFELPAPADGKLIKILHQAGATVAVGQSIGELAPESAKAADTKMAKPADAQSKAPSPPVEKGAGSNAKTQPPLREAQGGASQPAPFPPAAAESTAATDERSSTKRNATSAEAARTAPAAAPAADASETGERPVEPRQSATPPASAPPVRLAQGGPAASKTAQDAEEEIVPMTMLRRTISRRLVEAQQVMAMLTTFNEVDMEAVQQLRQQYQDAFQKRHGVKLGLMSFFVKAAIDGLKQIPQLNAEVRQNDLVFRRHFDIGVAVATERGLVVPVLQRADRLSFAEVERAIAGFAQRAKDNTLNPQDLEGGTFTITNGGVFGSMFSTPIINPPQSGILGLHAIEPRPVVRENQIVIRPMMYLALTYDHRIVDGREAVLFLRRVKEAVENPVRLLVEV
jgi:2-oxoglutarate dehydrogenase E2 component (dihydrolipoamide succinyltransferase)